VCLTFGLKGLLTEWDFDYNKITGEIMIALKEKSFFVGICLERVFVLAIAIFALWLSTAPPVQAQVTHGELYTFTGEAYNDLFGQSVSGAGDVNNDGYADLIVGALFNDAGGSDAGRAYVYSGQTGALLYTFTGEAAGDWFGYSVSGAGDVNNDGYADLIVGAPWNDAGGSNAGRAYIYSGQTGALLYTFTGEAAYDEFGCSVSGAGDVDNNGYSDLIVGAHGNDAGGDYAGRAYVYSGQNGYLLYTFTGVAAGDWFGNSVSGAGDVNNDGYADLIVGAVWNDAAGSNAGRAYVYSGQTGALLRTFTGAAAGDYFGYSVSGAGDINNDGYADLIVGAYLNDAGGTDAGRAYVYSGQTGALLHTFTGAAAGDLFGYSVSGAGDVNKDGYADLIVGAYLNAAGGTDDGRAYVYSGQTGVLLYTFTGAGAYDQLGVSVSGAGDVNNDGYADLIVGANGLGAGRAYVFSSQEICSYEELYTFTGAAADDMFGYSVSGAGDVNNDGYADLIVGASANDAGGDAAGRAYVYSGQTGALLYTFTGEAAGDYLGNSVSEAGDVNNDGYSDLIVGADGNDAGGDYAGRAYVYSGQTGALLYTFTGEAAGDYLGNSVSEAGDVNGDGYADLIVGAYYNDAGGFQAGRAYVYSGQTGALLYTFTGATEYDEFGTSVSGAGDVNGDGYADLIVGAPYNSAGGYYAGRAYVYSGQTGALLNTFTGEAAYDWFGVSVSGAGDVNGDGYADLIVGAYCNSAGGPQAGRAYVYSGKSGALLYTFTGEDYYDQFGRSVSGAGDVNNDGYADLMVGAYYNDAGGSDAGRVYVYSGQTGALLYTFTGEAAGDNFGLSVSGAGDVNNDGYADLIVGAFLNDAGGYWAGRAYVYSCSVSYLCGDVNADAGVSVSDVVYLISHLFKGGPAPQCDPYLSCADANGDGKVSISDIVYLIACLFKGGPPPVC